MVCNLRVPEFWPPEILLKLSTLKSQLSKKPSPKSPNTLSQFMSSMKKQAK